MQNLGTLRQLSLGDLADDRRERGEREEKIMPSLMATSLRWGTHSARTKIVFGDRVPLSQKMAITCSTGSPNKKDVISLIILRYYWRI
jgi:hypothetical protein